MKVTTGTLLERKKAGARISALTAYDYPTARLLDEAGIDVLLVGDSLGMVVLGFPDTTSVNIDHMVHHTAAVSRARPSSLIVADLPYHTYDTPAAALENAERLIKAGAEAVKLEGGVDKESAIQALIKSGIPVMGHLGMLPQSIREEGGVYRVKGKTRHEQESLETSMQLFERLGVFAVVLELVEPDLAQRLTTQFSIPTIGIGSGNSCDGQILVTHDLIGFFPWFRPKFVVPQANVAVEIKRAAAAFMQQNRL